MLLLDLKDVLVQRPPWPLLSPGRVTVFEEVSELRPQTWNARILAQFGGTSRAAEAAALLQGGRRVINSGVILAPPAALLRHVDALVDEMHALGGRYDRWMVGVDQAAHMLLVHRNRSHTMVQAGAAQGGAGASRWEQQMRPPRFQVAHLSRRAVGPVLHVTDVGASLYRVDEQGMVRSTAEDNAAYFVVHQWNRAPGPIQRGIRAAYGS